MASREFVRTMAVRAMAFSAGVLVFWLAYFLRQLAIDAAHGGTLYSPGVWNALGLAGGLAASSGAGALLGLAAARGATSSTPVWLAALAGVAFGFFTKPALEALRLAGFPVRETLLGSLLGTAMAAVVFGWLFAQIVQMVRRRVPQVSREYRRIKEDKVETASLLLAASPLLLGLAQFLGVPGFG